MSVLVFWVQRGSLAWVLGLPACKELLWFTSGTCGPLASQHDNEPNRICKHWVAICWVDGLFVVTQVMYVTATSPYLLMTILLINGATLPGAAQGVKFYLIPDFQKIKEIQVRRPHTWLPEEQRHTGNTTSYLTPWRSKKLEAHTWLPEDQGNPGKTTWYLTSRKSKKSR